MLLETLSQPFRKARSVNQTSNGFVSKVPTATEPKDDAGTAIGASVLDLGAGGVFSQNGAVIVPYATGSNNGTFSMRAIGWRQVGGNAAMPNAIWIPILLGEWQCTLTSSMPGVAGKAVVATELFADTITIVGTTGGYNATNGIASNANDTIGYIYLSLMGFQKLELSFTTGGVVTDCNALVALL